MEKGDIVKIEMQYGGIVIGIIDSITVNEIWFKMYYYSNELYVCLGFTRNYKMLNITPEEIDLFKNQLLSQGYSYDDETKTVIHEL
jgi:hypothetical protein